MYRDNLRTSLLAFFSLRTSSSSSFLPTASSSSFLLIFSRAFSSFEAFNLGLNRACILIRSVVLNDVVSASPRISGNAEAFEEGLLVRKVSRKVCIWKVPGVSEVGMQLNDSRGETAVEMCQLSWHTLVEEQAPKTKFKGQGQVPSFRSISGGIWFS